MPKKILLADDSITIQKVVELTFSDGDYEVIATNNGAKAIQRLAEVRPDIILSDIIMPERNGYEVCEYVKSHPEFRHIPVILLTGTFEPFDPDRAEKAGCDAVVTKPFESQSLIHKVEELIQQSGQRDEEALPVAAPFETPAAASASQMPPSFDDFQSAQPASFQEYSLPSDPWEEDSSLPSAPPAEDSPFGQQESNPAQPLFTDFDDAPSAGPAPHTSGNGPEEYGSEIFSSASDASAAHDLPMEEPVDDSFAGETRSFPMGGLGALPHAGQQEQQEIPAGSSEEHDQEHDEEHDFDETASFVPRGANSFGPRLGEPAEDSTSPQVFGGESSFEEEPPFAASADSLPLQDQGEIDSGQTKLIPKLSYEELVRMREQSELSDAFPDTGPAWADSGTAGGEALHDTSISGGAEKLPFDSVEESSAHSSRFSLYGEPDATGENDAFSTDPISLEEAESEGLLTSPALEPDTPEELEEAAYDEESLYLSSEGASIPESSGTTESADSDFERAPTMEKPFAATLSANDSPWSDAHATAGEEASDAGTPGSWSARESGSDQMETGSPALAPWEEDLATPAMSEPSPWDEQPAGGEPAWSDSPAALAGEPVPEWPGSSDAEPAATETSWEAAGADAFTPGEEPMLHAGTPQPAEEPVETAVDAGSAADASRQDEAEQETPAAAAFSSELSDEQVERIARRVVEMISERWVRDIAWEVVPDMAEMIVKERIRQLESET
jgi:CheY-like chemotaxis protein